MCMHNHINVVESTRLRSWWFDTWEKDHSKKHEDAVSEHLDSDTKIMKGTCLE